MIVPEPKGEDLFWVNGCLGAQDPPPPPGNPPRPLSRAPSLCPATVPPTASAKLNGICNGQ